MKRIFFTLLLLGLLNFSCENEPLDGFDGVSQEDPDDSDNANLDTDGDSILDIYEDLNSDDDLENDDTDADGIPNYLDEDDDNDGINTINEDYNCDGDVTNDDMDANNIPDYLYQDFEGFYLKKEVSGNSQAVFDLFGFELLDQFTAAGLFPPNPNHTVKHYETFQDANNDTNMIVSASNYTNLSNPQIIYSRIDDMDTGTYEVVEVSLFVNCQ